MESVPSSPLLHYHIPCNWSVETQLPTIVYTYEQFLIILLCLFFGNLT